MMGVFKSHPMNTLFILWLKGKLMRAILSSDGLEKGQRAHLTATLATKLWLRVGGQGMASCDDNFTTNPQSCYSMIICT